MTASGSVRLKKDVFTCAATSLQSGHLSNFPNAFPYHKQTVIGSCGPACVMMVLRRFKPEVKATRWLELASWSRTWLLPLGPTDEYGLSYLLASRDLNVEVFSEYPSFRLRPKSRSMQTFTSTFGRWMLSSFNFNRRRALAAGVKESFREVNCELLIEVLGKGCFPIVMVDQSGYAPDDSFPDGILHWVVVTKYADDFYVHDPDLGALRLSTRDFGRGMDLERNFGVKKRIVVTCIRNSDD